MRRYHGAFRRSEGGGDGGAEVGADRGFERRHVDPGGVRELGAPRSRRERSGYASRIVDVQPVRSEVGAVRHVGRTGRRARVPMRMLVRDTMFGERLGVRMHDDLRQRCAQHREREHQHAEPVRQALAAAERNPEHRWIMREPLDPRNLLRTGLRTGARSRGEHEPRAD